MEAIVSDLLNRFENGALSRRGMIQERAMLTAAGAPKRSLLVSLHHKSPTGLLDRELKEHGAAPDENLDAGFHIKNPEGLSVQIGGPA